MGLQRRSAANENAQAMVGSGVEFAVAMRWQERFFGGSEPFVHRNNVLGRGLACHSFCRPVRDHSLPQLVSAGRKLITCFYDVNHFTKIFMRRAHRRRRLRALQSCQTCSSVWMDFFRNGNKSQQRRGFQRECGLQIVLFFASLQRSVVLLIGKNDRLNLFSCARPRSRIRGRDWSKCAELFCPRNNLRWISVSGNDAGRMRRPAFQCMSNDASVLVVVQQCFVVVRR